MSPDRKYRVSDYQVHAHKHYAMVYNYPRTADSPASEKIQHQITACVTVMSASGSTFLIPRISEWVDVKKAGSQSLVESLHVIDWVHAL